MSLLKKLSLSSAVAAQCLFAGLLTATQAQAASIPDSLLKEWTVSKNCTEPHAGLAARVDSGLKFQVVASQDGSYLFKAVDNGNSKWAANWNGIRLEYRPGSQLTSVPADFECIPGQEASSPFLAMSGFAQATEPYYEPAHLYGLARIHGEMEHILVFLVGSGTNSRAIIVMQSVNTPGTVKLDTDGVIHSQ